MTLHTALGSAPAAADLDAARLGLSRADLLTSAPDHAPAPTFAEYIPGFVTDFGDLGPFRDDLAAAFDHRRLNDVVSSRRPTRGLTT